MENYWKYLYICHSFDTFVMITLRMSEARLSLDVSILHML